MTDSRKTVAALILAAVLPAAVVLGWQHGLERLWNISGWLFVLLQPLLSAVLLVTLFPGRGRWRLPLLAAAAGLAAAALVAWTGRVHRHALLLSLGAQVFVAAPAFLVALVAHLWARRAGLADAARRPVRLLLALGLAAGMLMASPFLEGPLFRKEVDRAKEYADRVVAEVRREEAAGRLPVRLDGVMERLGEPPPLIEDAGDLHYERYEEGWSIGIRWPTGIDYSGWTWRSATGEWEYWVG